ncbi:MAG: hypothetical protein RLZZ393_1715 [Pseudomonadota bacterium]|jgi:uncharacterized protein YajQ (UPF0234 family)
MPSFDVVSEIDRHELTNAVDQSNRELAQRFDFRGKKCSFDRDPKEEFVVHLKAEAEPQLRQMHDILIMRLVKRGIETRSIETKDVEKNIAEARQTVVLKHGIDQESGKKVNKLIKDSKLKVTSQIQGDKVRVTGKSRDDLQAVIALLRKDDVGVPLQFENFRD